MRPQGVDHLGPLARQQIARSMKHQPALLLGRFDLHETHGRPPHSLADRFGVSGIVLVALDVGFHVLRWHQPHPVAKLREFTCSVMGRGAGLHADPPLAWSDWDDPADRPSLRISAVDFPRGNLKVPRVQPRGCYPEEQKQWII